jgi:hypothetical protein
VRVGITIKRKTVKETGGMGAEFDDGPTDGSDDQPVDRPDRSIDAENRDPLGRLAKYTAPALLAILTGVESADAGLPSGFAR